MVAGLVWADVLLLLRLGDDAAAGWRRRRLAAPVGLPLHATGLVAYPTGSIVTCGAAVWGGLLAAVPPPHATAALVAAAWIGGAALRLVVGTAALLIVLDRLPEPAGRRLRDLLAHLG